jgi:hypothetical protein
MSGNDPETLEREKNKDKEEHFWREDLAVSLVESKPLAAPR